MTKRLPRKAFWSKCAKCGILRRDDQYCSCMTPDQIAAADRFVAGVDREGAQA